MLRMIHKNLPSKCKSRERKNKFCGVEGSVGWLVGKLKYVVDKSSIYVIQQVNLLFYQQKD